MKNILKSSRAVIVLTAAFLTFSMAANAAGKGDTSLAPEVSRTIVISQAYGGGGGASGTYTNDYVELKNVSSRPLSLDGLSLMYGSATGQFGSSSGNIFVLPSVTLAPGQYYLVQTSAAGSGGAALPVPPDATTTNLSMAGTNGKLALVAGLPGNTCGATATPCTLPNPLIVDVVAWGTANNAEGGAATNGGAALTAIQGNVRKGAGCQDTDNNNLDFDVVTDPIPRNSATTPAPCANVTPRNVVLDANGDGKSDYVVVRNVSGNINWYVYASGVGPYSVTTWGSASTDVPLMGDYDGDGKDDIAVYRAGAPSTFYILNSQSNTIRVDTFGNAGDDPKVVGDYNGDGRDDVAVFHPASPGVWYYKVNPSANYVAVEWGEVSDRAAPGDYDGDGKADFVVERNEGSSRFYKRLSGGTFSSEVFGTFADSTVSGDYDGDGKTDLMKVHKAAGGNTWSFRATGTAGNPTVTDTWGIDTDFLIAGDYNGDGKTEYAVYRSSNGTFYTMTVGTRQISTLNWGVTGDGAAGVSYVH